MISASCPSSLAGPVRDSRVPAAPLLPPHARRAGGGARNEPRAASASGCTTTAPVSTENFPARAQGPRQRHHLPPRDARTGQIQGGRRDPGHAAKSDDAPTSSAVGLATASGATAGVTAAWPAPTTPTARPRWFFINCRGEARSSASQRNPRHGLCRLRRGARGMDGRRATKIAWPCRRRAGARTTDVPLATLRC